MDAQARTEDVIGGGGGHDGSGQPSKCPRSAGPGEGIEAHLLGRPDLLRQGQQAPRRHHQQMGRGQRHPDRSRDDQPERDRAEGLGGGRVEHDAGCSRSQSRSAAAAVAAGRHSCPVDGRYDSIGKAQGGWFAPVAIGHRYQQGRRRPHRHSLRRVGQPAPAPRRSPVQGRLQQGAHDLGGTRAAGRGGEQAAALRARPRAVECRRRQRADRRPAVLWRADRRRHRHQGGHQVGRDARISALGEGRLGQEVVSARRDDLGRRRRQPGLSRRTGRLHRQHRLCRHRGEDAGSGTLQGDAVFLAARRPQGRHLRDRRRTCAPSRNRARTRMRRGRCSSTSLNPNS